LRALNALRLEKNWAGWAHEYRPIYGPVEAGLERFIDWNKNTGFIGREAAIAERKSDGKLRLVTFTVDAGDGDVLGDEPIHLDGRVVGWVTSGGYAHYPAKSMAMGYVPRELAETGSGWEIEILGEKLPAVLQKEPSFDPSGDRMRG
jgi:dimethylglycine dehydrogenase